MLERGPKGTRERVLTGLFSFLMGILATFQVAVSFHHHADLDSHDDCPTCVAAHQESLAPPGADPVVPVLATLAGSPLVPGEIAAPSRAGLPCRSRGPPSLV